MNRAIAIARAVLLTSIVGGTLSACSNTVEVHYTQRVNCFSWDDDPTGQAHNTQQSTGAGFIFYGIKSIKNEGSQPKDFKFDPAKIFANTTIKGATVQTFAGGPSFSNQVTTAKAQLVPKGATVDINGDILIDMPSDKPLTSNTPQSERTAKYDLFYKSGAGESVLMVRDAGPNPKFVEKCTGVNPG